MRKLPLALACALVLGSSSAFAIGLGEVQTQSNLNQPLRVTIPITDVRPGDVDALSVKIGDEAQFARHGYSLMSVYGRIKLQIVGGQRPHILLTSDAPVRDPVLGLVLEVEGPSGRIERAVSVLLDPEGYKPLAVVKSSSGRAAEQVATQDAQPRNQMYATARPSTRHSVPVEALPPIKDGGDYTAVSGDTAYGIAMRVKPDGVSLQQTIDMILQANPQAFANPADAGSLLAGKTLTIPNAQAMRQARPAAAAVAKSASVEAAPAAPAAVAQEPRLDIVQATAPIIANAPVVAAPVVGEVVSGGSVGAPDGTSPVQGQAAPQTAAIPAEVQEQIEASKVENERLTGLLASQDQRLQKMEELLRLNETLIKEMEQKMSAAAAVPAIPVAAPVEASTPWWSFGLMGLGALLAAVLAFVAGSRRRSKEDESESAAAPSVSSIRLDKSAETEVNVAAPLVAAAVVKPLSTPADSAAADVIEDTTDPVKAALDEVEVMQAYGLHDRAIQVLSDALQAQPGNAVLMARRARAMHEAGDADGFLAEAEAFRKQHPDDEVQWAELRALGAANYPTSPLFGAVAAAGVLGDDMNPWAQPSVVPVENDEASALIQPLDRLDLGAPDSALDELLSSQAAVQPPLASLDMPPLDLDLPLELDLPAVSNLTKAPGDVTPALDDAAQSNLADLLDVWAPLELPGTVEALPVLGLNDAPGLGATPEVSAEDLDILGIESQEADASALVMQSANLQPIEPDFAEDLQAAQSEMDALSLDVAPLSLDMPAFDLPTASLELDVLPETLPSASIEPLELPLELPLSTPMSNVQASVSAPIPSFGMMSEHEVKLDIASAYMDMGDHAGAREMLQEVLSGDADELLKHRASQMLSTLSV